MISLRHAIPIIFIISAVLTVITSETFLSLLISISTMFLDMRGALFSVTDRPRASPLMTWP